MSVFALLRWFAVLGAPFGFGFLLLGYLDAALGGYLFFMDLVLFVELFLQGSLFLIQGALAYRTGIAAGFKTGLADSQLPASEALGNIAPAYYLAFSWGVVDEKGLRMQIEYEFLIGVVLVIFGKLSFFFCQSLVDPDLY